MAQCATTCGLTKQHQWCAPNLAFLAMVNVSAEHQVLLSTKLSCRCHWTHRFTVCRGKHPISHYFPHMLGQRRQLDGVQYQQWHFGQLWEV